MTLTNDELLKMKECAKYAKITEKSQLIGSFVKWLETEKKIVLADYSLNLGVFTPTIIPLGTLLAEYFQVDLQRVEDERSAMLQHIKDKTAANVQEMQNIAFSLGKNHREIF